MSGKLEIIYGPVCSGKSSELIRRIRLFKIINKKILVIKPKIDNRYNENKITSHNLETFDCVNLEQLNEVNNINEYDCIVIDEGQFFPDLKNTIICWLDKYNVHILVAGLDGDFEKKPIGQILDLIPHAEKCHKVNSLCTLCNDGTEACFSYKKTASKNQIEIGGLDIYLPVCRKHYSQLISCIE
jgi:thymidine kinase